MSACSRPAKSPPCGASVASRNGIMMISHYLHLLEHEGEQFGRRMIIRGSLERLVPVLMTALVAALAKDAPGKEILYPVATVILGALLSSTFLDIIVTPVVFWLLGQKVLAQYRRGCSDASLDAQTSTSAPNCNSLPPAG
ncbi:efflux RND transporter permease subunit [Hymenobacter montanus]|uniref:efflux RND transporter permease subunit n=1 Tax=Hymenobacter montanus TaxID=2771359 RepID=UPI001CC2D5DA|nr:efflux RND transporter permease subunit [Hymenobacter montanus]